MGSASPFKQLANKMRDTTMTNYESQVAKAIAVSVRKHIRTAVLYRLRHGTMSLGPSHLLSRCLPELAAIPQSRSVSLFQNSALAPLARSCVAEFCKDLATELPDSLYLEIVRDLWKDAALLDIRCHLPPVKKSKRKRRSTAHMTLTERRAAEVQDSLKNWQRKAALAKTKIASLKKRARYYSKAVAAK
jgi:hypothetical protein